MMEVCCTCEWIPGRTGFPPHVHRTRRVIQRLSDNTSFEMTSVASWIDQQDYVVVEAEEIVLVSVDWKAVCRELGRPPVPDPEPVGFVDYAGPDPAVECAYPPCHRMLRLNPVFGGEGKQWCSKEHRGAMYEQCTATSPTHGARCLRKAPHDAGAAAQREHRAETPGNPGYTYWQDGTGRYGYSNHPGWIEWTAGR